MLTFSKSEVNNFRFKDDGQRYGQSFYNYFKLHKITNSQDKLFCDKLYNADYETAKVMISSRIDNEN